MENFLTVASQVGSIFILMIVGYICGKANLLKENAIKSLSNLVLYVATPMAILQAFVKEEKTAEKSLNLLWLFLISAGIQILSILIAKLTVKNKDKSAEDILRFCVVFSNCGYMAFPLQKALLGEIGVFYGAMYVVTFNTLLWTYGAYSLSKDKGFLSFKKIVTCPAIIATVFSVLLYIFELKLPNIIGNAVTHLGNLNTPIPMIIVGYYLSCTSIKSAFTDKRCYVPIVSRLVFVPIIAFIIMYILGIRGIPLTANVIAASAPSAAVSTLFATKFRLDYSAAVNMITVTNILSIITMPLFVMLTQAI